METNADRAAVPIGISGSYGGMNLGDEAILEGILGQLRATLSGGRHRLLDESRGHAGATPGRARHPGAVAHPQGDRARDPRAGSPRPRRRRNPLRRRRRELPPGGVIAHELGIPVILYAISAGPLATRRPGGPCGRRSTRSPPPVITVRDRLGYRLLEDVGVTSEIHLTADPAFLLEPEELPVDALEAEGVEFDRHLVGFSVREPGPAAPAHRPGGVLRAAGERRGLHRRALRGGGRVRPDGEDRRPAQPRAWSRTCRTPSAPRSCGVATRPARSWTSWGGSSSRSACASTS